MRIYKIIACLCTLGITSLYALTAEELIKMIDDGETQVKTNTEQIKSVQTNLKNASVNVNTQKNSVGSYIKQKDAIKKQIDEIKRYVKQEQDRFYDKIKDVPTLPKVVTAALKPFEDSYNSTMGKIDAMLTSLGNILDVAQKGMTTIQADLDKSINTIIPAILQKSNDSIAKLEELKQRAPAIATYVTGVSEQIK